jgi:hypothetical protein
MDILAAGDRPVLHQQEAGGPCPLSGRRSLHLRALFHCGPLGLTKIYIYATFIHHCMIFLLENPVPVPEGGYDEILIMC